MEDGFPGGDVAEGAEDVARARASSLGIVVEGQVDVGPERLVGVDTVGIEDKGEVERALEVAKDMATGLDVCSAPLVGEAREEGDDLGDVRSADRDEVEEASDEVAEGEVLDLGVVFVRRCLESLLRDGGQFDWVAVEHAESLEEVPGEALEGEPHATVVSVADDLDAQEGLEGAVVRDVVLETELSLELVESDSRVGSDELVVDAEGDDDEGVAFGAEVDAGIRLERSEADRFEPSVDVLVEDAVGLLEPVERFEELADVVEGDG